MNDDVPTEKCQAGTTQTETEVEIHFVDSLPGGRVVLPVEADGRFAWLVVHGHISTQAAREMVNDLNFLVRTGVWRQTWPAPHPSS